MQKRFFFRTVFIAACAVFFGGNVSAETRPLVEVLERKDCIHCQNERAFLEEIAFSADIEVRYYDISGEENRDLFRRVTEIEKLPKVTPTTIAGGRIIQGFDTAETTGKRLLELAENSRGQEQIGFEEYLSRGGRSDAEQVIGSGCEGDFCAEPEKESLEVTVPFVGKTIDVSAFSLPVLSVILGFIDGFNPCAMWVLVTFLLVLLQVGDRSRMWTIAGLFIVAEAIMYYLILNVWFTTFDFIGLDRIVTPIVGLLAIGGGAFFLYEWKTADGTCKVVDSKGRARISTQIKKLASEPLTWISALGVIALAFSVNVIEFACSIGIPQAFTKIIELHQLGFLETQGLMGLYIVFYMIDDLLVFGLALWGFEKLHMTAVYSKWANLFGGILMLILGALLFFFPDVIRVL